jgi:hypothetical protein
MQLRKSEKLITKPALFLPVKRAVVLADFEVLRRQLSERGDASTPRVLAAPQKRVKTAGFRAIPGSFFASLFVDTKSDSPAEASLRCYSAISCKLKIKCFAPAAAR